MSNVTLSIDDDIIKRARLRAVQEGSSLSAKMRDLLRRYALGQFDNTEPDLSFVENARIFSVQRTTAPAAPAGSDAEQSSVTYATAALAGSGDGNGNGQGVDPNDLRVTRGWARQDLYDRTLHSRATPPTHVG